MRMRNQTILAGGIILLLLVAAGGCSDKSSRRSADRTAPAPGTAVAGGTATGQGDGPAQTPAPSGMPQPAQPTTPAVAAPDAKAFLRQLYGLATTGTADQWAGVLSKQILRDNPQRVAQHHFQVWGPQVKQLVEVTARGDWNNISATFDPQAGLIHFGVTGGKTDSFAAVVEDGQLKINEN
ncbi:MAG: hypothetical protein BIFFINMI_00747 [Phycisphaerae bacterium]|nr:hypothetical protein [Phycisphaerae bacterium]